MRLADFFFQRTRHKFFYNITPICNIPSIINHGILCFDIMKSMKHWSIAMDEVQSRRDRVTIPGGGRLHKYANVYFTYNNPMLYKRKDMADDLCVLIISADILDIADCVLSDRNAATSLVKFYSALDGIECLDFEKIYTQYWTHSEPYEYSNHKAIKCAEILIPDRIPYDYIVGAYVVSEFSKQRLENAGFVRKIVVKPDVFYR